MILFVDSYYVRHNTDAIDFLYDEVRKAGGEPVCVFLHTYPNPATGSLGISKIVDTYLLRGGRPIIDAVINTMGFSLSVIAVPGCGEQKAPDDFLTRLGVPVIQAVNLYGSADDWKKSPFGLSAADIAMSVVSPEYDGDIDGVPYCGTEKSEDGEYRQAAIPDRCEALAEMAVRWARLRRIPEKGKKVAILIYMYPPRQDLAGGGYGLDTMESVCRLLAEMRSEGYSVDWIPEGSRDLADRLLAGITNDDNWHSDEQMRVYIKEVVDHCGMPAVWMMALCPMAINWDSDLGASWHPAYPGHKKWAHAILPYVSTITGWPLEDKVLE